MRRYTWQEQLKSTMDGVSRRKAGIDAWIDKHPIATPLEATREWHVVEAVVNADADLVNLDNLAENLVNWQGEQNEQVS